MNKTEYAEYEQAVAAFMAHENLTHLCTGHHVCPECGADWNDADECPNGHGHRECQIVICPKRLPRIENS